MLRGRGSPKHQSTALRPQGRGVGSISSHSSAARPRARGPVPRHSRPASDPDPAGSSLGARAEMNSRRCPGGRRRPNASSWPGGCRGCTSRGAGGWWPRGCLLLPWPRRSSRAPGSRRGARLAREGQSRAELVHSSRELCSRVHWPGSPPLPRLGPGTTLQIPASGINSDRLFP